MSAMPAQKANKIDAGPRSPDMAAIMGFSSRDNLGDEDQEKKKSKCNWEKT
jgi:hypothetical protein